LRELVETIFFVRTFPGIFGHRTSKAALIGARVNRDRAESKSLYRYWARCAWRPLGAQRRKAGPRQGRKLRREKILIFGFQALRLLSLDS
jgi:hypothetical protein